MNRINLHTVAVIVITFGLGSSVDLASGQQTKCPDGPNKVAATVAASVSFDSTSNLYLYEYSITNSLDSEQEIDDFRVDFTDSISMITSPEGWTYGFPRGRSSIGWGATKVENGDEIPDDAAVPKSIVQIKQGDTLHGFSFKSPQGPGAVKYYVLGFVDTRFVPNPPQPDNELAMENLLEACPQLLVPVLDQAVVGLTQGPSNAMAVQIDIKPGSDPNAINPRNQGVVPVAILGGAGFDVNLVAQSSVRLGPGESKPQNDKGHLEDVNGDGFFDLVFQFPTQDIKLRCFDRTLVLTGNTTIGKSILGLDAVVTVGCKT
jgi:hypothetical protein